MAIDKLIRKFEKVKSAINSIKGIQSKIQSINYTTAIDALDQAKDEAETLLKARKQNLQKQIGSSGIGKGYAKQTPTVAGEDDHVTFPIYDVLDNYIVFTSKKRLRQGSNIEHPVYRDRSCALYIPDALISQANVTYQADGISGVARAFDTMIDAGKDLISSGGEGDGYKKIGAEAQKLGTKVLLDMQNTATSGLSNLKYGRAKNPMQEQLLSGIPFRSWDFTFDLYAKTRDEAQAINKIIYFFRSSMLPDTFSPKIEFGQNGQLVSVSRDGKDSDNLKYFNYPNVFEIAFDGPMGSKIDGFLPAVCANCQVDYTGGQKFSTFDDGQPVHIQMTLNFLEIKTMNLGNYDAIVSPYAQQQGFGGFEQQKSLSERNAAELGDDPAQVADVGDASAQENISSSGGGGGF